MSGYSDPTLQAVAEAAAAAMRVDPTAARIGETLAVAQTAAQALDPVAVELRAALDADKAGDFDGYVAHLRTVPIPAHALMAMKKSGHDDVIRKYDLNTSLADATYGPSWLDRED